MVISGPWPRYRVTATQAPTIAATIGMTQTSENLVRFFGTALDWGTGGSGGSRSGMTNLFSACGIPDQPRIEGLHREHGEHYYRREEDQAGPRLHRHQRLQLYKSRGE